MQLIFKRFNEYLTLEIDRAKKRVFVIGEQTNYKRTELAWRMLWDRCDIHRQSLKDDNSGCKACDGVALKQDKETSFLSDEAFADVFRKQMLVYGFELKNGPE